MPRERPSADGPKPRLLIVDDELTVARALKRVLTQYEITVVDDANQAFELLRVERNFDVILCDLMMPGVTGPELYQGACRVHPALQSRFVFMTGGAFADWAREFLALTRCPVLTKPFNLEDACEIVERILGQTN
jgi:DNA-binding NtrC family response regulator